MTGIPPPPPPIDPTQAIQDLTAVLDNIEHMFTSMQQAWTRFPRDFSVFVRAFRRANGGMGPGGNGGNGGNGGGGNVGGGNSPQDRRNQEAFNKLIAGLNSLPYGPAHVKQTIDALDNLQRRALASNTNLTQVISKSSGMNGVRLSEMARELLALREEGINELNQSTLFLIARMKRTDQSTAGLVSFLGKNSLNLLMNTKQAQEVAKSLSDFGRTYGMREDKTLEVLNNAIKAVELPTMLGMGQNVAQAMTELTQQLGGRSGEAINKMVAFLSDPKNFAQLQMLGVQDLADQLFHASVEEAKQLLPEIARQATDRMRPYFESSTRGPAGLVRGANVAEMFGGLGAKSFQEVTVALQDAQSVIQENNNTNASIKALYDTLIGSIERLISVINTVITPFLPVLQISAKILGPVLAYMAVLGSAAVIVNKVQEAFRVIQMARGLGGLAGGLLGGALNPWALGITAALGIGTMIYDQVQKSRAATEELNRKTKDQFQDSPEMRFGSTLTAILDKQVRAIAGYDNPNINKEMLQTEKQLLQYTIALFENSKSISDRPELSLASRAKK